jgi:hypothetical protein
MEEARRSLAVVVALVVMLALVARVESMLAEELTEVLAQAVEGEAALELLLAHPLGLEVVALVS